MPKNMISHIVKSASHEIITNTHAFISAAKSKTLGEDIVSVMFNGEKTNLDREDYNVLKAQNRAVKTDMKNKIKEATAQLKSIPTETGEE